MRIHNLSYENTTEVLDLGYSDHLAKILHSKADNPKTGPVIVRKRQFQKRIHKNLSTSYINYGNVFCYVMMSILLLMPI
jgi:hypothetical protein